MECFQDRWDLSGKRKSEEFFGFVIKGKVGFWLEGDIGEKEHILTGTISVWL